MADSVKVVEYLISLKDALKIVKVLSKKKHRRFNWEFELEELPFEEARTVAHLLDCASAKPKSF
jgi:hypothetical protein